MRILPRIDTLIAQDLDDLVESHGDERAEERTDPVDPVLALEVSSHHTRTQAPSRVQGPAGVVDASELGNEECEPDSDGRDERSPVLLRREHEYRKDELEGQDGLDKDALRETDPWRERGADVECRWEHARGQACCRDAT